MKKKLILATLLIAGCATNPNSSVAKPEASYIPVPKEYFVPVPYLKAKASIEPKIAVSSIAITDPKVYAQSLLNERHYACLLRLWNKESRWNHTALNKSSGAYGIPQALPGSKMKSAGADWKTNPITQVKWGIGYINERYGSACKAWDFWLGKGWY